MDSRSDHVIQDLFEKGLQLHQAGELPQAETIYRQVLDVDPDHADANQLLGVIANQTGNYETAAKLISKAIRKNPLVADYHSNLGNALKSLSRLDDAVDSYNKAIVMNPDLAVAHNNLGNTFQELGQPDKAVASYRKALQIAPDYAEAHSNLADTFRELGRLDDAVASCHKSLAINPDNAEAHGNLGAALQGLNRLDEAIASYHRAIAINPGLYVVENNLGCILFKMGKLDEAVASYHKSLAINPDYAVAYNNLGNVLKEQGKLDDAVASYRKALTIKPEYSGAGRNLLYVMLNVPGLSPHELFTEHVRFSENHVRGIARPAEVLTNDPTPDRRLRIGYLSSDLRNHPVGSNVLPLLSLHDRAKFEIFCYADVLRPDAMTERFRSCVDHWRTIVGKPDPEVAGMVRADAIDVLVCLAGRYDSNRPLVCAHRAAPVQVSYHDGATSGLEEMDYWLTDDFLHPPDTKEMFTEELHRLPVFYQFPPIEEAPTVETLPAERAGFVTFGSFNNPAKVNEEVIRLWAKVLKSVPGSRLLLKYKNLYDQALLQGRVVERFAAFGVAQERVIFAASPDTFAGHLGRYGEMDIALDTFPYNGATTTFQALWMGVPVVSLAGETFISRAAGSILHHVGLGELAVDTPEAYVACARNLAGDLARLRTLRETLRERISTSPLCNAPANARRVESAFRDMWRTWCAEPRNIP
jgi:predicted O-linked N-acetylglucosamine transferase (SPINDLY family)